MGNENEGALGNQRMPNGNDQLGFKTVDAITNMMEKDEEIVHSQTVNKQNRFFMWQKRNFLLTSKRLCNLEGLVVKRTIPLNKLKAVTKSTQQGNFDFIIHV